MQNLILVYYFNIFFIKSKGVWSGNSKFFINFYFAGFTTGFWGIKTARIFLKELIILQIYFFIPPTLISGCSGSRLG